MNTSSSVASVLSVASNGVAAPTVSDKPADGASNTEHGTKVVVALTANESETLTSAYKLLYQVLRTMGKEGDTDIAPDYLTNPDTLGALLARGHRVFKSECAKRAKAEREAFAGKIDAIVQLALDKRAKALKSYMALDAADRAELGGAQPSATVTILIETIVESGVLGKGYDVPRATATLHAMGYMVHAPKVDGRSKSAPTPPYLTATVGGSIRTNAAK